MTFTFTFLCRLQRGGRTLDSLVFISNSMFFCYLLGLTSFEEAVPSLQERCFKMLEHPSMQRIKNIIINVFIKQEFRSEIIFSMSPKKEGSGEEHFQS